MRRRREFIAMRSSIIALGFCMLNATASTAMDREELKNVRPEVRQWFDQMRSPGGQVCCSYADGHRTDYDMRQGQYWIPIEGEWYPVPPEAVIYDVNPIGDAVVWYLPQFVEGMTAAMLSAPYKIFCFVPSGGV